MAWSASLDRGHESSRRCNVRGQDERRNLTVAVDTNIVVRALADDDPDQSPIAREILQRSFALTASVLVETEWVLRSLYRWDRKVIAGVMMELADLPDLAEAPARLRWAIKRFAAGADFADMIHLAAAEGFERFVTFDRGVARKAGKDVPLPIETLRKR